MPINPDLKGLRLALWAVIGLNLGYFFVESFMALHLGSVSLFADSVDFFEDSAVNMLIIMALSWPQKNRARVGMLLATIIMIPAIASVGMALHKFNVPSVPNPLPLGLTGAGALIINTLCAFLLVKYKNHHGSLTLAAFYSARNDMLANVAIILAGLITVKYPTPWPDLVVGLGIALINMSAAREVMEAARAEYADNPENLHR